MQRFMKHDFCIHHIILACRVMPGDRHTVHKNRPSHGLAMHLGGEKTYSFSNGKSLDVRKNDIIYMPKYSTYSVKVQTDSICYAINFDFPDDEVFEPFVFSPKNAAEYSDSFARAERIWSAKTHGYSLKCKSELFNILYNMQREHMRGYAAKHKIDLIIPAVEYIHENYFSELPSISELAAMCGITPEYFRSVFRSCYGISPVKYINNLRFTRAKELILSGLYSVSDAAELSGFSDISYFSREFKKHVGVTPSEYRTEKRNS